MSASWYHHVPTKGGTVKYQGGDLSGITHASDPRERLLDGLAEAIAESGYPGVTVADVVRRAQTSKRTFYEHFSDKDAAMLALYETMSGQLLGQLAEALQDAPPGEARIGLGVAVYLTALQSEPALVRTLLVEILHVGPAGLAVRRRVLQAFAAMLAAESRAVSDGLPEPVAMAVVGGINELILQAVEEDRVDRLVELAGPISGMFRALVLGSAELVRAG